MSIVKYFLYLISAFVIEKIKIKQALYFKYNTPKEN